MQIQPLYNSLSDVEIRYQCIILDWALGKDVQSRLRTLLKNITDTILTKSIDTTDQQLKIRINALCRYLMAFYARLLDSEINSLSSEDKVLWMASKIYGQLYYPYKEDIGRFQLLSPDHSVTIQLKPFDVSTLVQGTQNTCSFASAFLALSSMLGSQWLLDHIVNVGHDNTTYYVTFHVNGCQRTIVTSTDGIFPTKRYIHSLSDDTLLWPGLVEQSYLKLNNCLNEDDYTGSNFANDCYVLSGFIPEYASVNTLTPEKLSFISHAFHAKQCVVGIATSELTSEESIKYHLISQHDYSIISIDKCILKIRDSIKSAENPMTYTLNELYGKFHTVYLNWKPDALFKYCQEKSFPIFSFQNQFSESAIDDIQFHVSSNEVSTKKQEVWILLERYLPQKESKCIKDPIVSTIAFDSSKAVWTETNCIILNQRTSNGSRFILCKVEIPQSNRFIYALNLKDVFSGFQIYSASFYSNIKLKIKRLSVKQDSTVVDGQWSPSESGGSWSNDTYIDNPQYELILGKGESGLVDCEIGLFCNKHHIAANVFLDDNRFRRLTQVSKQAFAPGQSTEYKIGSNIIHLKLQKGIRYIIVCSMYEAGLLAPYRLLLRSESSVAITRIPNMLGLFEKIIKKTVQLNEGWLSIISFRVRQSSAIALRIDTTEKCSTQYRLINKRDRVIMSSKDQIVRKIQIMGSIHEVQNGGDYTLQARAREFGTHSIKVTIGSSNPVETTTSIHQK